MLEKDGDCIMDYHCSGPSILFHMKQNGQSQYRSTSYLLPKCRAEALRDKRTAVRSKINLIARQLYELKYNHEWQEQQLQKLLAKGENIMCQVDKRMREVKVEVQVLAGQRDMEGLGLDKVKEKQGNALGSQRSTQPEREDESIEHQKTQGQHSEMEQTVTVIQTSKLMTNSLKITKTKDENMLGSVRVKTSASLRPATTKKATSQHMTSHIPLANILLFVCLLVIVFTLL